MCIGAENFKKLQGAELGSQKRERGRGRLFENGSSVQAMDHLRREFLARTTEKGLLLERLSSGR